MLGDNMNLEEFDQALKSMVVAYNSSVLNKSGRRSIRAWTSQFVSSVNAPCFPSSDAANVETFVVDVIWLFKGKHESP